ncbi:MAG: hypothetical protein H7Y11_14490 [Armatimonadetes bacterium]|nr:hypothetical protein [Anaerolineae bacterium]
MSIESYIRAMPKADLGLQLEGAVSKATLLLIADQNDIPKANKVFIELLKQLEKPNYDKLPELITAVFQWVRHPDDLSRMVYDVGVTLAKQNVRYAEIGVQPLLYMNNTAMTFEQFVEGLNDGRDRVMRGWQTQLHFVLNVPRDEPRRADDVARWAQSVTGRKNGVIGLGLVGREEAQPTAQFERPFKAAEKKATPRIVHAGDKLAAEGTLQALQLLAPTRIIGGWGAADAPDVIQLLAEGKIPLTISMARQLCLGRIATYKDYPLRHLFDADVPLSLTAHMPGFYKSSLTDEYLALVEHNGFSLEELEEVALNAVVYSTLAEDSKAELLQQFAVSYRQLRAEHLDQQTA